MSEEVSGGYLGPLPSHSRRPLFEPANMGGYRESPGQYIIGAGGGCHQDDMPMNLVTEVGMPIICLCKDDL